MGRANLVVEAKSQLRTWYRANTGFLPSRPQPIHVELPLLLALTHQSLRLNSVLSAVVGAGPRHSRLSGGMPRAKPIQEVGMGDSDYLREHCQLTRRYFFQLGCAAAAAWSASPLAAASADVDPQLQEAIARLEYLTPVARGRYIDKGKSGRSQTSG